MTARCGMCGEALDNLSLCLDITLAPGQHGHDHYRTEPRRLEEWWICWACLQLPTGQAVLTIISDEYMEVVRAPVVTSCRAVCSGSRQVNVSHWRRFWSIRQGTIGVPPHGKCPVCGGQVEAEIAGERAA